jgi:hypothetical protein
MHDGMDQVFTRPPHGDEWAASLKSRERKRTSTLPGAKPRRQAKAAPAD